jgi:imidazolonepropionase-like amidohydrolase
VATIHINGVILPETEPRDLWISDGVIVDGDAGPGQKAMSITDCWVLPGLVDAHCHIGLGIEGAVPKEVAEAQAITDRNAGTLLIRDAGSPSDTYWIDDRDDLPRIVRAGRHIARTRRYIRNLANEVEPEDLVAEVEKQAHNGQGWVKIVGDWIDRSVGDLAPCWPADVAAAAIEKAHGLGVRMTAHCFAEEAVATLVDAGIDCIEHGTGISPAVAEKMAAQGTGLVPTMVNIENFPKYAADGEAKYPTFAAHYRSLFAKRHETFGMCREAGVPIYCGTDAGTVVPHGMAPQEVVHLGEIGDADFALGAATWRARPWLGHPNLELGASADLVVYAEDPRKNLRTVLDPQLVILRGVPVAGSRLSW